MNYAEAIRKFDGTNPAQAHLRNAYLANGLPAAGLFPDSTAYRGMFYRNGVDFRNNMPTWERRFCLFITDETARAIMKEEFDPASKIRQREA